MRTLSGTFSLGDTIEWIDFATPSLDENDDLDLVFPLYHRLSGPAALATIQDTLRKNGIQWFSCAGGRCVLNLTLLRETHNLSGLNYLEGTVSVAPEIKAERSGPFDVTSVTIRLSRKAVAEARPMRIFLSHKGEDKPLVRRFRDVLKELGFHPWLDEDMLTAGVNLDRELLQGFKDSCAAVFFITPAFRDERFLSQEIELAVNEHREKGPRFSIITLVFADSTGATGTVPELLKRFLWKTPASELDALREILRALPVAVGPVGWVA